MSNVLSTVKKRKNLSLDFFKYKQKGQVSEWFKEVVLKTTDGASYPGVRIPPCPVFCKRLRTATQILRLLGSSFSKRRLSLVKVFA